MPEKLIKPGFVVVIPARYGSSRLPGKPLLDIGGKTMIQRVYEQATQSQAKHVVIATDDQRIMQVAKQFGADVCMTKAEHVSGTDRLQEVVKHKQWSADTIVVNVQGDEPLIPPVVIDQVAENLFRAEQASVATLCERIRDIAVFQDPNAVKVVFDNQGYALYFSRAPIPWPRDAFRDNRNILPLSLMAFRHIGIYAYRAGFLHQFISWPPATIEATESLEQLRAMANGVRIHVQEASEHVPGGVDTEADLFQVRQFLGR